MKKIRTMHLTLQQVDWILDTFPRVDSREQAVGMCQVLLEDGCMMHGV